MLILRYSLPSLLQKGAHLLRATIISFKACIIIIAASVRGKTCLSCTTYDAHLLTCRHLAMKNVLLKVPSCFLIIEYDVLGTNDSTLQKIT